jgi:hypothetical protein
MPQQHESDQMGRMDKLNLQGTLPSAPAPSGLPAAQPTDRRAGKDRRSAEVGPPGKRDRRTALEARKPQVIELEMSPSEWAAFTDLPLAPGKSSR